MSCSDVYRAAGSNGYIVEIPFPEDYDGTVLKSPQPQPHTDKDVLTTSKPNGHAQLMMIAPNCEKRPASRTQKPRKPKRLSYRKSARMRPRTRAKPAEPESSAPEVAFEVEDILGHRLTLKSGAPEFLLRWKGYPDSENSWEPPDNLEGCSDILYSYIVDKIIRVSGDLPHITLFINLLPENLKDSALKKLTDKPECPTQRRPRKKRNSSEAPEQVTTNGFIKKKKRPPRLCEQENTLQENCTTRSSLKRSLYIHGIVTPPKSQLIPPPSPSENYIPSEFSQNQLPSEFSSPISPDCRLVRFNSTSSLSTSDGGMSFHLRITPSPQLDSEPNSPQPDRLMDAPITPPSPPSACISRHILHKQTVVQTPGPLPRAKRKILCSNTLPSKAAKPSPVSPQRPLQRHNCELPILEKVISSNGLNQSTDVVLHQPLENGVESSNIDMCKESSLSRVGRIPESAGSLLYKELLLNWQHELNKQRDGTDEFIIVENIVDRVPPPVNFTYISSNRYAPGVPDPSTPEVSSSLCGCECYSLGKKCGTKSASFCCPSMACVAFAYTRAGKVQVQPGTPIYECNSKCSCPPDCVNKVVQHGRKIPLCIFRTPNGRGWGVRSMQPIRAHSFVTEYVGEVITSEEAEKRGHLYDEQGATYLFDLDFDDDNSDFTIDAAKEGNISHFFNHSCQPNLVVYSVWIECLDKRLPRIAFFTTRNISSGEELTFDYHMNHNQSAVSPGRHKKMRMRCLCEADKCLGYYY